MRTTVLALAVMMSAVALQADDRSVTFDKSVDFAAIRTFSMRETKVISPQPELSNTLFASQIGNAIRKTLVAKGLTENADLPDVTVESTVTGIDYVIGTAGRANPQPPNAPPSRFGPVAFTDGTLVVDLMAGRSTKLIWHGVYRRTRESAARLAEKLPDDAAKLLSVYPPKKK